MVVVVPRLQATDFVDLKIHLRRIERPWRRIAILRQQSFAAEVLPKVPEHLSEGGEGECIQAAGSSSRDLPAEEVQNISLLEVTALEESISLARKRLPPLFVGRRFTGEGDHHLAADLPDVPASHIRQLRFDLELAFLGLMVGAMIALIHQSRFFRVQLDEGKQVLESGAGVVLGDDRCVLDPVMGLDRELYLIQLDSKASQLYLIVRPAGKLGSAIGVPVGQVAGLVEFGVPISWRKRVVDKSVLGQVRAVQVASRELDSADVQLADLTHSYRGLRRIENIVLSIVHGRADRDGMRTVSDGRGIDGKGGGIDGAFSRAVQIDQVARRQRLEASKREILGKGFPAAENLCE